MRAAFARFVTSIHRSLRRPAASRAVFTSLSLFSCGAMAAGTTAYYTPANLPKPADALAAAAAKQKENPPRQLSPAEAIAEAQNYKGDPMECPCIQDMKNGPCGAQFVDAYRCFLDSSQELRGSDCVSQFRAMQQCSHATGESQPRSITVSLQACMMLHPEHYKRFLEDDDEDEEHVGDDSGDGTAAEKDVTKEAVKK